LQWIDAINMDTTHLLDALPGMAGRPFSFYAEALQKGIEQMIFYYNNAIYGKWGDATGSHHSATSFDVDGMKLQEKYCKKLGLNHMIASSQVPARELLSQIVFGVAMPAQTMAALARYIRWGRSSDVGIFRVPRGRKGSTAMPHKDASGGNPSLEEQTMGFGAYMAGEVAKSLASCVFDYGRGLEGSALDRIMFDDMFKWGDYVARRLAERVYELELIPERCIERVNRTYGVVTSQALMNHLIDKRKTSRPMTRKQADELAARLATEAYDAKRFFADVCMSDEEISSRFDKELIRYITNPFEYVGQSKEIVREVFNKYHGNRALD
jgi:adenylosuccinate lyase